MMLTIVVVCDLTLWSPIYSLPWKLWHELYQVSSESSCQRLGKVKGSTFTHHWPYELPREQLRFEERCGPNGKDCEAR